MRKPTTPWLRSTPSGTAILLALSACGGAGGGPAPTAPVNAPDTPVSYPEPAPIERGLAPTGIGPYAQGVDVRRYDVELGLSDRSASFAGRSVIRLQVTGADVWLPLDFTGLAVDGVWVEGVPARTTYENGVLGVDLAHIGGGSNVSVRVDYHGTPDDGLFIGPNIHGAPSAFVDNWPNRTRFWMPTVDHPSDKALVRFTIHAPEDWHVIANGYMTAQPRPASREALGPASGPRQTWVWDTVEPIPTYTMVVGAARMDHASVGRAACGKAPASQDDDGCVAVSWMAFPQDTAQARRIFARAADMVDYYADLIGPFPYEKLANVQSATQFGGMENSSAIFYTGQGISAGTLGEGTVAHEIAHQWFGDSVTEGLWSHIWLSEGFATYFGALFFEHAEGVEDFRERLELARQAYITSDDVDRPVVADYDQLFDLLNRNSYQKGGLVLHMLRGVMGDDAFFEGIRRYYGRYAHGNALTGDLQAVMTAAHGSDLDWFFDQWIRKPGHPTFEVSHRWLPSGSGSAGQVELTIRQTQRAAWPRFRMPATVALVTRGADVRRDIELSGAVTTVRVDADREPERVVLDPDGWILKGDVTYR